MSNNTFGYKDGKDTENLTQVVAVTLDEVKAGTDQIMDVYDVNYAKAAWLPILNALFGFQIDQNEDVDFQRKQLRTAIDVIKNKGTLESFNILFYNLGFAIELIPQWTPDYFEDATINLPYIQITNLPPNAVGDYDLLVVNPDQQFDTVVDGITYIL